MKGLKEFLELLKEDKDLMEEVKKSRDDSRKVVEIAKKHGYEFTKEEFDDLKMEAVTGGVGAVAGGVIAGVAAPLVLELFKGFEKGFVEK